MPRRAHLTGLVVLLAALAGAGVLLLGGSGGQGDAEAAAGPARVYPAPGTDFASAKTEISFRGVSPAELGPLEVRGGLSGRHSGELRAHSDGRGASFVPRRPFRNGERVFVRTQIEVVGGESGDVVFRVARRPDPRRVQDGTLNLPTLPPAVKDTFRSRRDLKAPVVRITKRAENTAPGLIMLAPVSLKGSPDADGPLITDDKGDLVWFRPLERDTVVTDLKAQDLGDRRVLTWWQGRFALGWGYGEYVVLDEAYQEVARINAGNGYEADLHDITFTPRGTAMVMVYDRVVRDLRSVGGPRDGVVLDNVLQEIDVQTGHVLWEWHSLDHVGLRESRVKPQGRASYDYFHINSVEVDSDGNYLISARNTCAVYKIDANTGEVLWTLGGRNTDFEMGRGTLFCFQHDARRVRDGVLSLFDNAAGPPALRKRSRAIVLAVDEGAKTARLLRAHTHPGSILAPNQGSTRVLPNGNVFVGWGAAPVFSSYAEDGRLLFNGRLTAGKGNYRAVRAEWTGRPGTNPAVAAQPRGSRLVVWASWNGATEVARWEVLGGPTADALRPIAAADRDGFETTINIQDAADTAQVAVRALDARGEELGVSRVEAPRR